MKEIETEGRNYYWFVEPLDSHTNLIISNQLSEENSGQFLCTDQQHHNLWRCSFEQALSFWKSKRDLSMNMNVWNQQGRGDIRPCNFLFAKKKKNKIKTA